MRKVELLNMQKKVATKMMSAIALLLVSAIMMVGVSYAWITISKSPEVRGIHTAISGNGYLEIALQSPLGNGTLTRANVTSGRGDSMKTITEKNKTWGNVIDLSTAYGLGSIILYPSRINVNKMTSSVNTGGYLSVPEYGSDGRITQMTDTSFMTYSPNNDPPYISGRTYGVNILGTTGEQSSQSNTAVYYYRRSIIRDEAAGYLEEYRSSLRNEMISLLESQQVGILNIILRASQVINSSGLAAGNATWTDENVETGKTIINRMYTITRDCEPSLKWALLALAIADDTTYPPGDENAMTALGTLYREFLTYPLSGGEKSIKTIAENNRDAAEANGKTAVAQRYQDLIDAVDSIVRAENQLGNAKVYIYDESTVTAAFLLIIDVQNTFLKNGSEPEPNGPGMGDPTEGAIHRIYEVVDENVKIQNQPARGIYYNYVKKFYTDYLYFVGATPGPTTGLFSIMANLLGDYQATNQAYFKSSSPFEFRAENNASNTWKQWTMYLRATGKSGSGSSANEIGMDAVSQYNVSANRGVLGTVYDDIMNYNPGNAMISFSVERCDGVAYGYSIDLAFRTGVDCDLLLAQDSLDRVYGKNSEELGEGNFNPDVMGGGSNAVFNLSGDLTGPHSNLAKELINNIYIVLIDTDSGGILGIVGADTQQIVLEQANVTLAVYEPVITEVSGVSILSKGQKRTSNVITSLTAKRPTYITAIVFLNGDTLPNGAIASTQYSSLYGTINLQFKSSEEISSATYPEAGG